MTKFRDKRAYEQGKPENILEEAVVDGARKIKQIISEEGLKITSHLEGRIPRIISGLEDKYKIEVDRQVLLNKALEMLNREQGGLPEKLQKEYISLIAEEIANKVASGKEFYKVLGEKMVELKRTGVEVDGKKVEESAKELI